MNLLSMHHIVQH